jgi:hypothetical protein
VLGQVVVVGPRAAMAARRWLLQGDDAPVVVARSLPDAWSLAAERAETTLILGADARPLPDVVDLVAAATGAVADGEVPGCRLSGQGDGAVIIPAGVAAALAATGAETWDAGWEALGLGPVVLEPAAFTIVTAVAVVEVGEDDDGPGALADRDPDALVLAVPAGGARVVASATELAEAGAELVGRPAARACGGGRLVLGRAASVAAVLAGTSTVVADPRLADLDDPATTVVAVGGRLVDVGSGLEVLAVTGAPGGLDRLEAQLEAGRASGLGPLLRYDGAADDDGAVAEVAPELFALAFWTPRFCATVIEAAEATGAFAPHADDPVPGAEVSLAAISPRLFAHVEDDLAARVVPVLRRQWPLVEYQGLRDAFVIRYVAGGGGGLRLHHDLAQISASVRLNDGYGGGALEFPRQGFDNRALAVGQLLAWPSLVTHPHRSRPVEHGVKYSLTLWFELPGAPVPPPSDHDR